MERLKLVNTVCSSLQSLFLSQKQKMADTARPWNFDGTVIFKRLGMFQARVSQILALFDIIMEFARLEKVEIGGTKVSVRFLFYCSGQNIELSSVGNFCRVHTGTGEI